MKEIEEGIHEVHAKARELRNNEKESQEDKEMTGKTEMVSISNQLNIWQLKYFHYLSVNRHFLQNENLT